MNYKHLDTLVKPTISTEVRDLFFKERIKAIEHYENGETLIGFQGQESFQIISVDSHGIKDVYDLEARMFSIIAGYYIDMIFHPKTGWEY
jgi:hypothetical protein